MTVHNFSTQYNTEQFWYLPSYLQTNIIAQMLSIGGEGFYDVMCWRRSVHAAYEEALKIHHHSSNRNCTMGGPTFSDSTHLSSERRAKRRVYHRPRREFLRTDPSPDAATEDGCMREWQRINGLPPATDRIQTRRKVRSKWVNDGAAWARN